MDRYICAMFASPSTSSNLIEPVNSVINTIRAATEVLLPRACLICGWHIRNRNLCGLCRPSSESNNQPRCCRCFCSSQALNLEGLCEICILMPIPFRLIRFIWAYNGRVQRLITTMKYRPSRHLARFAGQELTRTLPTLNLNYDWDYIVPLPSAITSLRARLFNQCVLIANELKRTLEIPIALNALYHRGAAAPQASLALAARIPNVRNAFKVNKKLVETKRILLIDDVITSGATSTVAALSLLSAGASSVDLLALAQAESWQTQRYNIYRNLTEPALTKEGHINLSNSKVT